jgi:hypothetical protein
MTATLLALLLSVVPAPPSRTAWMNPEVFKLSIGMSRMQALGELKAAGFEAKPGKNKDEMFVDYSDEQTLTLHFRNARLASVRFELFTYLPDVRRAFDEAKADLLRRHGQPRKLSSKSIVVYDSEVPNVMLVLSADPNSAHGKKGLGFVAVRYYDPR